MHLCDFHSDEWRIEATSRTCTSCGGDLKRCNGHCNGSAGMSMVRRPYAEIMEIRAKRERAREDAVLAEAATILARRAANF